MVPLAEAWDSGAKQWTKQRRVEYANYLDDDRHLVAVSQRSNRQKSDQDVTTWIVPDNPSQRCRYLADQVAVKLGWDLSVDPAEQAAMRDIAVECPGTEVTVNPVPCPGRRVHLAAGRARDPRREPACAASTT
jgi:hypothetical protein